MADKLRRNYALRKSCLNEMQTIKNLATAFMTNQTLATKFKVRYNTIDSLMEDFLKHHALVVSLLAVDREANLDAEDEVKSEMSEMFYEIKAIYTDFFQNESQATDNKQLACSTHIKLPKIELNKFRGDIRDFPGFRDMFDSLVHSNGTLNPIEKFNYLKSSLEGSPLELVKRLKATADNYDTAYAALIKRYTNPRAQARAYWLEIENFPSLKSENPPQLRKLLDTFSINLEGLKNMDVEINCDFVLCHMLLGKLDSETAKAFERVHGSTDIPKFDVLCAFLESHCNGLINIQPTASKLTNPNAIRVKARDSLIASSNKGGTMCVLCSGNHSLYACGQYLHKTPRERYHFCKSHHLCFNCLSRVHTLQSCQSKSACKKCGSKRHHTSLHFEVDKEGNSGTSDSSSRSNKPNR